MTRFRVGFLVMAAAVAGCGASRHSPKTPPSVVGTLWSHQESPWSKPPPEADLRHRYAEFTLMRLLEHGRFEMLVCVLNEENATKRISRGDGQLIYLGSWTPKNDSWRVRYRLMDESIRPVGGGTYPGPEREMILKRTGTTLAFDSKSFVPATGFDPKEFERFFTRFNAFTPAQAGSTDWPTSGFLRRPANPRDSLGAVSLRILKCPPECGRESVDPARSALSRRPNPFSNF